MNQVETAKPTTVSPEELGRLIAEGRRIAFESKVMPHVVYHGRRIFCPWPGCSCRISGIDFQLEAGGDSSRYAPGVKDFWQGAGLVGRCPGCGNYVLFSVTDEQAVADPAAPGVLILPDDWHQTAYIVQ